MPCDQSDLKDRRAQYNKALAVLADVMAKHGAGTPQNIAGIMEYVQDAHAEWEKALRRWDECETAAKRAKSEEARIRLLAHLDAMWVEIGMLVSLRIH